MAASKDIHEWPDIRRERAERSTEEQAARDEKAKEQAVEFQAKFRKLFIDYLNAHMALDEHIATHTELRRALTNLQLG